MSYLSMNQTFEGLAIDELPKLYRCRTLLVHVLTYFDVLCRNLSVMFFAKEVDFMIILRWCYQKIYLYNQKHTFAVHKYVKKVRQWRTFVVHFCVLLLVNSAYM
jgi:hypothetical protein